MEWCDSDTFDLNVRQRAGYSVTFTYLSPPDPETPTVPGPPINVTGWTALMQFRDAPGKLVLLELTDGSGITVGTDDGTFAVMITGDQTATLNFRSCFYDLFVTAPGGEPINLVGGRVSVKPAISVAP